MNFLNIKIACSDDFDFLKEHDKHIKEQELKAIINQGRIIVCKEDEIIVGWLRYNLFWDNIPFMNMLYFLEDSRKKGYGKALVSFWESKMKEQGYSMVMTSTLSNEESQFFYRKLGYIDSGSLLLKDEPLEIIFTKEL